MRKTGKNKNSDTDVIDAEVIPPEEETSAALVIRRLSIVPEGAEQSALALIDEFALAAPSFTEGSEKFITNAEAFEVSDQAMSLLADTIQDELKREVTAWDNRRLGVTRTLDDLKSYIISLIKDGIENRRKAISIYQAKISSYRAEVRRRELEAQREAERLLAEERRKLEEEARKKEERANQLKTAAAKQKALDEAARLREQAEMVPESVAVPTSGPALAASTAAQTWEGRVPLCDACKAADAKRPDPKRICPHNMKKAVETILSKWDEWGTVITLKPAGLNDMARKYKDTLELPGLEFTPKDSYRSKAQR